MTLGAAADVLVATDVVAAAWVRAAEVAEVLVVGAKRIGAGVAAVADDDGFLGEGGGEEESGGEEEGEEGSCCGCVRAVTAT